MKPQLLAYQGINTEFLAKFFKVDRHEFDQDVTSFFNKAEAEVVHWGQPVKGHCRFILVVS